jgi:glutaconate CoA-transferase subunit A
MGSSKPARAPTFTSCVPDYDRDEAFQKEYAEIRLGDFHARYLPDRSEYQAATA